MRPSVTGLAFAVLLSMFCGPFIVVRKVVTGLRSRELKVLPAVVGVVDRRHVERLRRDLLREPARRGLRRGAGRARRDALRRTFRLRDPQREVAVFCVVQRGSPTDTQRFGSSTDCRFTKR